MKQIQQNIKRYRISIGYSEHTKHMHANMTAGTKMNTDIQTNRDRERETERQSEDFRL